MKIINYNIVLTTVTQSQLRVEYCRGLVERRQLVEPELDDQSVMQLLRNVSIWVN